MGLLGWVRKAVDRTPSLDDVEAPAAAPEAAPAPAPTPAPTPAPEATKLVVLPLAPLPRRASTTAAATAPRTSAAQIASMLDRVVYRGELVDRLLDALKAEAGTTKDAGDRLFLSTLVRMVTNDGLDLPALPDIVVEIQRLLAQPDCSIQKLAAALSREPVITTKIIGVASSALYAGRVPVRGLNEALARIGQRETQNIVMAIIAKTKLFRVPAFEAEAQAIYRRALAASVAMQVLAKPLGLSPDEAFLAGLMHDLGHIALLAAAAEVHRQSQGQLHVDADTFARLSEHLHAPLGALIAETWEFGEALVGATEHHHRPDQAPEPAQLLGDALFLADEIAARVTEGGDSQALLAAHPAFAILGIESPELLTEQAQLSFQAFERAMSDTPVVRGRAYA